MDKKTQKKLYEEAQASRRRYPPIFIAKKHSSLRILEIVKKNEKNINWSKFPGCRIPKEYSYKTDISKSINHDIDHGLGDALIQGISDAELESFWIDLSASEICIFMHIIKLMSIKTGHGNGHYLEENKLTLNDKIILLSNHAIDRIKERTFCKFKNASRYEKHLAFFRTILSIKIGDCYENKLEVFCPMKTVGNETVYCKIGYLVLSEQDKYIYAKSFVLPGYVHTPEEKILKKPWEELFDEEMEELDKSVTQFKRYETIVRPKLKWEDFSCMTSAWRKFFPY